MRTFTERVVIAAFLIALVAWAWQAVERGRSEAPGYSYNCEDYPYVYAEANCG